MFIGKERRGLGWASIRATWGGLRLATPSGPDAPFIEEERNPEEHIAGSMLLIAYYRLPA